jgi:hypothetical protein
MFNSNVRNPFACRGVGCVKLPATAAFPTDDKLLQRIEQARRALPRNSMKALWRAPQAENAELVSELLTPRADADSEAGTTAARVAVERVRAARAELGSTLLRIEDLYPHGRSATG